MNQKPPSKDLDLLLKPYSFLLQEGQEIKENYLDYSLKLLWQRPERLVSKATKKKQ